MKSRLFPLIPLIVSLLAASALALLVEDFVHRVIVAPLLHVAWFVTLLLQSVAQEVYWIVFIIIALVIAYKSIPRGRPKKQEGQMALVKNWGAVATWCALLERGTTSKFSQWRLAQALKRLTWDLLHRGRNRGFEQLEDQRGGSIAALPLEIDLYFQAPLPRYQRFYWLRDRLRVNMPSEALDLDPEKVIEFLENRLDPLTGE